MKTLFRTFVCAICLLLVNTATATPLHLHFHTPYANPFDPDAQSFTFEATLEVTNSQVHIIQTDPACTWACDEVWFSPDARLTSDAMDPYTMVKTVFYQPDGSGRGSPFYFAPGALWTVGTHYDIPSVTGQLRSVLTVSAVPEPSTYVLLLAGGAVVAVSHARLRARGRQRVA